MIPCPFSDKKHAGHFSSNPRAVFGVLGGTDITQAIVPFIFETDADIFSLLG